MQKLRRQAFRAALKADFPVLGGIFFLAVGYGVYMAGKGFSPWWPTLMAATIYAGSMEFIVVGLLLSTFNPLYALALTFAVNGRHLFYGLSILEKYWQTGWKRCVLIPWMCDEAFTVNFTTEPPAGVPRDWYMFFVTLQMYVTWVFGAWLGGFVGTSLADLKGIEFVMPALFIVIFVNQWQKERSHLSSLLGVALAVASLWLFGERYFLLPALVAAAVLLSLRWRTHRQQV